MIELNDKGKPAIRNERGKLETLDCIRAFLEGGVTVQETMEELKLSKEAMEEALKELKL